VTALPTVAVWSPDGSRRVVNAADVSGWVADGWTAVPPPGYTPPAPEPQRERRGTTRDGSPPVEPRTMGEVMFGVGRSGGLQDVDFGREGPGARHLYQLDLRAETAPSKIRRL
jgi:hypothetical protein